MNKLNMAAFVNYMPEHLSGSINVKVVSYTQYTCTSTESVHSLTNE